MTPGTPYMDWDFLGHMKDVGHGADSNAVKPEPVHDQGTVGPRRSSGETNGMLACQKCGGMSIQTGTLTSCGLCHKRAVVNWRTQQRPAP